ncbi:MAG: Flp pilus assembly complex ATPase component TadA [Planctomycetes bacterium]|nr:Flp pilus assembly complex ATPase component TadA [Planctomycetota bacterium]
MSGALEDLIRRTAALGASDFALEPDDDAALVAVARIDGVRSVVGRIARGDAAAAIARLKSLAGLPAYITDEAQDGRIDGSAFGIAGDLRASFLPTVRGQRAAIRLPSIGILPTPDGLGLPEEVVAILRALARRPDGLIVVAGPTGSGKTTTLHSVLAELALERQDRHVLTIEDPVERRVAGITQIEVAAARGFGFCDALTAALRHDPDVIVVGEVRDPGTAIACVRAALTGHLVLTTVHAGRAAEVVPRLIEMGVDPDLLLPALTAVLAQRLVRRRHLDCRGLGCAACTGGFSGRQAVSDLLILDQEARARL